MAMFGIVAPKNQDKLFNKYKVNLFIDNSECDKCK